MNSTRTPSLAPAVTPADIAAAAERIVARVRVTPVMQVAAKDLDLPIDVTLKLELLQHVGSFKPRGAFNRVLAADAIPTAGLIAASGGNHGAAVAFVAQTLGIAAEVFVPSSSPAMKRERIASLGATVNVIEGLFDDAQAAAVARQLETGALAVHPFEHPDVVAGQGTMARELEAQMSATGFDTLLAATGGGGFIAGQAAWFAGRRRVVSIEPATSQCLHAARLAGEPVDVSVAGVAADSLGARRLGSVAWSIVAPYVAHSLTVDDDAIRAAQRLLWDRLRLVVEPGGATALAALHSGAYTAEPGERVVVVVCGANCDPATVTG
ncbi:MAG: threonine/serine dehydratase [Actinobacteria bacterium]|nr:threonine/serine dehydratase [Actinomycetota bacterium]